MNTTTCPPSSGKTRKIVIDEGGTLRFIHDDALVGLLREGDARIERASHVEPGGDGTQWIADLSPVSGPALGPFDLRQQALDAEIEWLNENRL